jgi:outer membrane protein assembly factor BamE
MRLESGIKRLDKMRFTIVLLSFLLASCSYLHLPTAYKMDIRQGNYVTQEMRDKLKTGMSRSQVKYVMGTPMVSDVFHDNRWDYVYRMEHADKLVEQQHLILYFDGDTLSRIDDSGLHLSAAEAR